MLIHKPQDLINNNLTLRMQPSLKEEDSNYQYALDRADKHLKELVDQGWTYRPYQAEFAAIYSLRRNNVCALQMGLGKTIIAGLLIAILYEEKLNTFRPGAVQIVCPSALSLEHRWLQDLSLLSSLSPHLEFIKSPKQIRKSVKPIWLYTHDFPKRKSVNIKGNVAKEISRKGLSPNLLIIDEAHQLKRGSKRSESLYTIRKRSKRVLLASGTIADGRIDLLDYICWFAYQRQWPFAPKEFKERFSVNRSVQSSYLYGSLPSGAETNKFVSSVAPSKLPIYTDTLQRFVHRANYRDKNVHPYVSLPERDVWVEDVSPYQDHQDYYNNVIQTYLSSMSKLCNAGKSQAVISQALQILNPILEASSTPPSHISNRKLELLVDYVSDFYAQGKKTAIFIRAIAAGRLVTNTLKNHFPGEVIRVYSQDNLYDPQVQSLKERSQALNDFLYGDAMAGVFSYKLCSESINLTSAEQIIFYDYPWSSVELSQGLHRVVRPGSRCDKVREVYLYNQNFIDEHQMNLLAEKMNSSSLALDLSDQAALLARQDTISIHNVLSKISEQADE